MNGIQIVAGAHDNRIEANLIAANSEALPNSAISAGILITGSSYSNVIAGNRIGLNSSGQPLGNGYGVALQEGATGNLVGVHRPALGR